MQTSLVRYFHCPSRGLLPHVQIKSRNECAGDVSQVPRAAAGVFRGRTDAEEELPACRLQTPPLSHCLTPAEQAGGYGL